MLYHTTTFRCMYSVNIECIEHKSICMLWVPTYCKTEPYITRSWLTASQLFQIAGLLHKVRCSVTANRQAHYYAWNAQLNVSIPTNLSLCIECSIQGQRTNKHILESLAFDFLLGRFDLSVLLEKEQLYGRVLIRILMESLKTLWLDACTTLNNRQAECPRGLFVWKCDLSALTMYQF